ncbi:hypothetical protein PM082_023466 [Marasmius tenuissimus]|nr:hypothetical protein PM082_023466 [Marasmius tenuissimus]
MVLFTPDRTAFRDSLSGNRDLQNQQIRVYNHHAFAKLEARAGLVFNGSPQLSERTATRSRLSASLDIWDHNTLKFLLYKAGIRLDYPP